MQTLQSIWPEFASKVMDKLEWSLMTSVLDACSDTVEEFNLTENEEHSIVAGALEEIAESYWGNLYHAADRQLDQIANELNLGQPVECSSNKAPKA